MFVPSGFFVVWRNEDMVSCCFNKGGVNVLSRFLPASPQKYAPKPILSIFIPGAYAPG